MPSEDKFVNRLRKIFLQNLDFFSLMYCLFLFMKSDSLESMSGMIYSKDRVFIFVLTCWLREKER